MNKGNLIANAVGERRKGGARPLPPTAVSSQRRKRTLSFLKRERLLHYSSGGKEGFLLA